MNKRIGKNDRRDCCYQSSCDSKLFTTSSAFIIREIQQKQSWIRDIYEENNEGILPFVGSFSMKDNPKQIAADIVNTLQIVGYTEATLTSFLNIQVNKLHKLEAQLYR